MERQFLPSAAKLTNGFPCLKIYETNIPREHYEQEIITLMSDFAGDSKFVKKQILQAQINLCNSALDWSNIQDETSEYIENKLKQLQQELKQLQDVDKNS